MASIPHSTHHGRRAGRAAVGPRTIAQTACLALGIPLVLIGIIGFFVSSDFSGGVAPAGDTLLGFEVNGWHNVAHIATGALLLVGAPAARSALAALLVFGVGYVAVTVWGFVDGDSVFRVLALNDPDKWLHVGLTVLAFGAFFAAGGLASRSGTERPPGT